VKLFHRSDEGRTPLYLSGIQAIWPVGSHGAVTLAGSTEVIYLAERAQEVAAACGYNAEPSDGPSVSEAITALRNELGEAWVECKDATGAAGIARAEGHIAGLGRALEILGYAES
jgi:hypothetical protein